MNKYMSVTLVALVFLFTSACQEKAEIKKELKEPNEKLGYALGMEIGTSLGQNEMEIDEYWFKKGFEDGFKKGEPLMTTEEIAQVKQTAIENMRTKMAEKNKLAAEKNKTDGEKSLLENSKQEGVVTTDSGLQYKILTEGNGPKPKNTDKVEVNYVGTLLDGTEFDSSYKRDKSVELNVNGVIKGWTEALQLMGTGSKWRLFIPENLAYGPRTAGMIGPNSTLIFEVELISIKNKAEDNS